MKKFPDKIPLYVVRQHGSRLNELPKQKYLVPRTMTLGEFSLYIRKQISLSSSQALFFFF